jgi:cytochrome P450 family 23 subfamily A
MADQSRLPYLNAAIQELQRIAVLLPMNFQRELLEDVQIGKYKFSKGTIFIPQFPSVHLDEDIFPGEREFSNIHDHGAGQ